VGALLHGHEPLPNPRVQRTRSSPSARHSPLTRHPLGGREHLPGLKLVAACLLGIAAFKCAPRDNSMHPLTELIPPDIVVIFKNDTSNQQINVFLKTVISQPDPRGGHAHRAGVGGIRSTRVGGYQGYVISWARSGTAADRNDIRGRIDRDPIVCKVFESVEPSTISPSDVICSGGTVVP
jgi:hypothetical protein